MAKQGVLNRLLAQTAYRRTFNQTALKIEAVDLLREEINKQGKSQKEIACQLDITPSRLSQILNTEEKNLTLNTLADMATALNKRFKLALRDDIHSNQAAKPTAITTTTIEVLTNQQQRQEDFPQGALRESPLKEMIYEP